MIRLFSKISFIKNIQKPILIKAKLRNISVKSKNSNIRTNRSDNTQIKKNIKPNILKNCKNINVPIQNILVNNTVTDIFVNSPAGKHDIPNLFSFETVLIQPPTMLLPNISTVNPSVDNLEQIISPTDDIIIDNKYITDDEINSKKFCLATKNANKKILELLNHIGKVDISSDYIDNYIFFICENLNNIQNTIPIYDINLEPINNNLNKNKMILVDSKNIDSICRLYNNIYRLFSDKNELKKIYNMKLKL